MKSMTKKIASVAVIGLISMGALTGCYSKSTELTERENLQSQSKKGTSLELENLKKKKALEDNPNTLRYVYILTMGEPIGYYVAKGKISSSSSQIAPEQDLIKVYEGSSDRIVMDSAKDDGSYGPGDPGIFFFTTSGNMIETSLDYVVSTQPMTIDVPLLEK
jgi:hypothetical protein